MRPFLTVYISIHIFLHSLTHPVEGGHRAIKYKRVSGVNRYIYGEGTHFNIPWFETPIIYDVRARPRNIASLTGTKGMLFTLQILF
jgi:prohibitin 2